MKHLSRWALALTVLLSTRSLLWELLPVLLLAAHRSSAMLAGFLQAAAAVVMGPGVFVVFLFSRLEDHSLGEQTIRGRIRELLQADPGLGISQIQDRLGIGWGTAVYHLNRLERARLVSSQAAGRRRIFFVPGQNGTTAHALSVLHNPAHVRLLRHVVARPGLSQQDAATSAGLSAPLAPRYLHHLETNGLVASKKSWRTRSYEATLAAHECLQVLADRTMGQRPTSADATNGIPSPGGTSAASYTEAVELVFAGALRQEG